MKLLERLALIKAGYTKKEIAEMEQEDNNTQPEPEPESEPETEPESEPDYKAEFEQLQAQYDTLKTQLENAQKQNQNKSMSVPEKIDPQEAVEKLINEFI